MDCAICKECEGTITYEEEIFNTRTHKTHTREHQLCETCHSANKDLLNRLKQCTSCGKLRTDVEERYSFNNYAGRLCNVCKKKYRDHCGELDVHDAECYCADCM